MANYDKNKYGEFGGVPGTIHLAADGHTELTPGEGARILRTYGIRNNDTPAGGQGEINQGIDPATGEKWVDDQQKERAERYENTKRILNGYVPEDVPR